MSGCKIFITLPFVNYIDMQGGEIITNGVFDQKNNIKVYLKGIGSISLNVKCDKLDCFLSGIGDIYLNGEVASQYIDLSGSGTINSSKLNAQDCVIDASGTGTCNLFVKRNLKAVLTGNIKLTYLGEPNVDKSISQQSTIIKLK